MLDVVDKAFPEVIHSDKEKELLQKMALTWNTSINETIFKA